MLIDEFLEVLDRVIASYDSGPNDFDYGIIDTDFGAAFA